MKSATSFSDVFESAATRRSADEEPASTDRALARLQPTAEAAAAAIRFHTERLVFIPPRNSDG